MKYNTSAHYTYSCKYHIIFCPKYRRKILKNEIASRLKELIYEKCHKLGIEIVEMEVMPDHVHLLVDSPINISPIDIVKKIKQHSSVLLKREFPEINRKMPCLWTRSAFIATVGAVSLETVKLYIENQQKQ